MLCEHAASTVYLGSIASVVMLLLPEHLATGTSTG
jgi:hypothetical protein